MSIENTKMKRYCLALDLIDDPLSIEKYIEHHNAVWPEVIESIQRKIKRTKELFENNEPKTFNILETLSLGLQYYG